jgi:hypothetical protein
MKKIKSRADVLDPENGFWALVDLFGHQRIAGFVSEYQMGGETFVRVDVPRVKDCAGFTRLFGKGAIYAISPTSADVASRLAAALRSVPIQPYELSTVPAIGHEEGL